MPRRASRRANTPPPPLSQRLLLARWFAAELGYENIGEMLTDCGRHEDVGDGRGVIKLILDHGRATISKPLLEEMDEAIRGDMERVNKSRPMPLSLKYFQYLAALSAEYVLRRIGDSKRDLAEELNSFAVDRAMGVQNLFPRMDGGNPAHFSKLAFWMATGAGKTLLMHLNYLQFMRLCKRSELFAPDNILLVTPNADMSAQHLEEMRTSSIPCRPFGDVADLHLQQNAVMVLDINKLTAEKTRSKKGISVPPETFFGRNLVFVDEGHKGAGGSAWLDIRDRLAKNGFAMEYSATFGNAAAALGPGRRESFAQEYARAIAFDYSYGHFHGDGYGKDYFILNMDDGGEGDNEERRHTLMTGNLMAFFQQQLAHSENPDIVREYQIAPPLLLMLGATVTGGNQANHLQRARRADILNLIAFLRRAADGNFLQTTVTNILGNNSGLRGESGGDLFADKFKFLTDKYDNDVAGLCAALRRHVFGMETPGNLKIFTLKKTFRGGDSGEIVLRADNAPPCALVYVGAARKFAELCREQFGEGNVLEDALEAPQFAKVNHPGSSVNILIGAKKFMEGWSSWRVSGIGLLNLGIGEGTMIVQLFGRGVRLQGRDWSLKRAAALMRFGNKAQKPLAILETLNIFGIRANFMSDFGNYLGKENAIWKEITVESQIFPEEVGSGSRSRPEKLREKRLPIPTAPAAAKFPGAFALKEHSKARAEVDMRASVVAAQATDDGHLTQTALAGRANKSFAQAPIDIDRLYLRLLREYMPKAGAMTVDKRDLPEVLENCFYRCDENFAPTPARLQTAAFDAVCQYADNLFALAAGKWKKESMRMKILDGGDKQHRYFEDYTVQLPAEDEEEFETIRKLVEERAARLYHDEIPVDGLPRIHLSYHLSQPLLVQGGKAKISPPPMNEGEKDFIGYLKKYAKNENLPGGDKIYAMRNHARLGVEFVLEDGSIHYPDFLLWVAGKNRRRLVFAEPHGMRNEGPSFAKGQLWKFLQGLKLQLPSPSKSPPMKVEMDSFIISVTDFNDLREQWGNEWNREEFADNHILFMEDLADENLRGETFARMFYPNGGD